MSEEPRTPSAVIARYGVAAYQLALAITGEPTTAEQAVLEAAVFETTVFQTVDDGTRSDDWITYLARVRARAMRNANRSAWMGDPGVQDPGEVSASPLPIESFALRGALEALDEQERAILWSALTSDAQAISEERLAAVLEHFAAALRVESYPSAEDIP
ncbi:MAG: hypothetical protein ACOC1U_07130 [Spirochaetota bacterium]